ncbi:haloacid dehalogenase-like hydrolase domain-containing protein 3 [Asterias rubens]|uniref:haloacid dehalogenase-like hydrolase domain-containing protein 3 n=1 Tax=Asterias rubens TaxID=7604 RepID=UPI00145570E4|nr:haloacid dehalogenase-like hydrolase domain-containing protein 3 [Asterias rubens]XP_033643451.1 haloacid dehalogenase-like hydrolase domain-containing protein 3 [Asterias rubens]XP_033643452.1 haloacid dehalogenase-like hydrolase domain-containing protein 3 [Asterias rubens]XP_033643453.1 haloacid dehalogenase-like hydrolase domain-containing protein 3 [Asterias rubens]
MLRYKVVTLDIHNTLMRVNKSTGQQYSRAARQYGIKLDPQVLDKAFYTALREQRAKHPNYGVHTGMTSSAWWSEVIRRTFMTSGQVDNQTISKIATTLFENFKTPSMWDVFPEVKSTLSALNNEGVCLGVISNCDERLMDVLRSVNLASHFAFILLSVYTGHQKPDAEIFRMAMERLKVQPEECLHVGDNVSQDYEGARAVGMSAVIVDRDGSLETSNPHVDSGHFIRDLSELTLIVKS